MTSPTHPPEQVIHRERRRRHRSAKPASDRFKKILKRRSVQLMIYGMILLVGIYVVYKLAPRFLDGGE